MSLEKSSEKWHLFFSDVSSTCSVRALTHWDNVHRILSQGDAKLAVAFKQICMNFRFTDGTSKGPEEVYKFQSLVLLKLVGIFFLGVKCRRSRILFQNRNEKIM